MNKSTRDFDSLPAEAILRLPDVIALVGLCRASIYARAAQQTFPSPIKLTAHASGWRVGEVRAWLANPTGWRPSDNASASECGSTEQEAAS
jgi:prophage regulatory protein